MQTRAGEQPSNQAERHSQRTRSPQPKRPAAVYSKQRQRSSYSSRLNSKTSLALSVIKRARLA